MPPGISPRMFIRKGRIIKTVNADGSGDYTQLSSALSAITDASADKLYAIIVFGKISDTAQIVAKAYVDVMGIGADITSTLVNDPAVLFNVGNLSWRNITIRRTGTPTTGNYHPVALFTNSACNNSCVVSNCNFLNEVTNSTLYGMSGADITSYASPTIDRCTFQGGVSSYVNGHNTGLNIQDIYTSPKVTNCTCIGGTSAGADYGCEVMLLASPIMTGNRYVGGSGASGQNRGLVIAHGTSHSNEPQIIGGVAVGGAGAGCDGLIVRDDSAPVISGLFSSPGTGATTNCCGATISHGAYPTIIGGRFFGGDGAFSQNHGIQILTGAAPTLRGSIIKSGINGGALFVNATGTISKFLGCNISTYGTTATRHAVNLYAGGAIIDGCWIGPSMQQAVITTPYDSQMWLNANSGRFQALSGYPYQLASMSIGIIQAQSGQTFDIGTTVGGDDIAADISLENIGDFEIAIDKAVAQIAADGYMYGTPSGSVADNKIGFRYTYCRNPANNNGINLNTTGFVRIANSTIIAAGASDALYIGNAAIAAANYVIEKCRIENINPAANAINAESEIANAPIYFSVFKGLQTNIVSCAAGTSVGTNLSI